MHMPTNLLVTALTIVAVGNLPVRAADNDALIKNAMSAAPEAVAKDATVITFDDKMQPVTLKKGTNGFTCMPDDPRTPGNDPMCLDQAGMEWAKSLMSKTPPKMDTIGFGYMLQGGSDFSNTDPFAEAAPAKGKNWVDTGPHVMIFNVGKLAQNYPRQGENPNTSVPYVMWPGTPFEHLMIPVK
jgi:hypothetical protein